MTTLDMSDWMYVTGVDPELESLENLPTCLSCVTISRPSVYDTSEGSAAGAAGQDEHKSPAATASNKL